MHLEFVSIRRQRFLAIILILSLLLISGFRASPDYYHDLDVLHASANSFDTDLTSPMSESTPESAFISTTSTAAAPPFLPNATLRLTPSCGAYPKNSDIVIIVKTGASEAFQKLPTQLLTFLQCAKDDLLIFSDMDQTIGEYQIHDSLAEVTGLLQSQDPIFNLYKTQKEYRQMGAQLSGNSLAGDYGGPWDLDKYKFIHETQLTYKMRPNRSWYFFIEADTYVVWSNLFAWLKRLDPAEKLYMGSKVNDGLPPFAHGGSGYLLSRPALLELVGEDAGGLASSSDLRTKGTCCGDQTMSLILSEKGINVTNVRPFINGDKTRDIGFGPKMWCQPRGTMHHVNSEEVNDMWQFEQQRALKSRGPDDLLLHRDLFEGLVEPKLATYRDDWDNLSGDERLRADNTEALLIDAEFPSYKSIQGCDRACKDNPRCFQFMFTNGECALSHSFKLGDRKKPEDARKWQSGWNLERIKKWKEENPCDGPLWEPDGL